ncbi:MAG: nucleotide sugar dehydrogenase [Chloroflexi bacterium]|nr:nucleotide sugar dehydrogenase [Chloroflexota bacterium]
MKTICVLGLGYVGLPTAVMFASIGHRVTGVDTNHSILKALNNGRVHISEPGVEAMVLTAMRAGNLVVRNAPCACDVFILAVPTPVTEERRADLGDMCAAAASVVPYLKRGDLVVLESTVPPETTRSILAPILERSGMKAGADFYVAYAPERVLPGSILAELVGNDRVIGGVTEQSGLLAKELYEGFVKGRISVVDATTAEMVKVAENTFRNVNVALANELALLGEKIGVDVWEVIRLANKHPRVDILNPGPGVGGHCIPLDPWFLVEKAPEGTPLIQTAQAVNQLMPFHVLELLRRETAGVEDPEVTIFGVTYKGNVDDVRESPALAILRQVLKDGFGVRLFDPHVANLAEFQAMLTDFESAVCGSHCILVLADHKEFANLDVSRVAGLVKKKLVIDTRNCLDHAAWRSCGFRIVLLGKGDQWR